MPTLEGGLRIDAEGAGDWALLDALAGDAGQSDLARRLGELVTEDEVAEDWREFVVPDLADAFSKDVELVAKRITAAKAGCGGEEGPLWITRDDGDAWYSTLNQARLELEEHYRFGPSEMIDPAEFAPEKRLAFMRSQFYCAIQSLLLDHVIG
ncbi:MAG: hypothetical protein ACQCXQ_03045 [Verrucomicrobiales bacterium]|nr:hypothetical protein [Verrucomicrobiota bacterium JB025]